MAEEAIVGAVTTVRPATCDDADEIGRIHAETWQAAYGHLLPADAFDVTARQRWWRLVLGGERPPGNTTVVAEAGGMLVGFAGVGPARDEPEHVGELYTIYVQPTSWDTGAGRALIARAEEAMRGSGYTEAMLWVLEGNERAERFYRHAGWTHDGGRKVEEFQGATVAELRYRKPL
jgi:GNAT superfamily N-acetyltransferase